MDDYLEHHGVLGMKWGVRRYQNKDGSYTNIGKKRHLEDANRSNHRSRNIKRGVAIAAGVLATGAIAYGLYKTGAYKTGVEAASRLVGEFGAKKASVNKTPALLGAPAETAAKAAGKTAAKAAGKTAETAAKSAAKTAGKAASKSSDIAGRIAAKSTDVGKAAEKVAEKAGKKSVGSRIADRIKQEAVDTFDSPARAAGFEQSANRFFDKHVKKTPVKDLSDDMKAAGKAYVDSTQKGSSKSKRERWTRRVGNFFKRHSRSVDNLNSTNADFINNVSDMMRDNGLG